ncbi:MAG: hypothetical protein ACPGJR_13770 [Akkermansiaceae bacterium]
MTTVFSSYQQWRSTMTEHAKLTLDQNYCEKRIAALQDESLPQTKSFVKAYGAKYRDQVIEWFQKALSEL